MNGSLALFSGRANPKLSKDIADYLKMPLGAIEIENFSDGEIFVQIQQNVRGSDVFVIQPTSYPGNENLMELLIIIDALKRASAKRITAVISYYGYARQDRKVQPRVPITAKLVADLISAAGTDRILTIDLHAGQIQGFFDIPVDHLFATPVLIDHLKSFDLEDLIVVAPDAGGVERARAIAKKLKVSLVIIDKRREEKNVAKIMNIIGEVSGKTALLIDDMIDTAGTLSEAAAALKKNGAKEVYAFGTHAILSGPAIDRLNEAPIKQVVVTDTIPLNSKAQKCDKIVVLSVAHILGEAIRRIHDEASVSALFVY